MIKWHVKHMRKGQISGKMRTQIHHAETKHHYVSNFVTNTNHERAALPPKGQSGMRGHCNRCQRAPQAQEPPIEALPLALQRHIELGFITLHLLRLLAQLIRCIQFYKIAQKDAHLNKLTSIYGFTLMATSTYLRLVDLAFPSQKYCRYV